MLREDDADGGDGICATDPAATVPAACTYGAPCDGGGPSEWNCEGGICAPRCTWGCVCDAAHKVFCNLGCP